MENSIFKIEYSRTAVKVIESLDRKSKQRIKAAYRENPEWRYKTTSGQLLTIPIENRYSTNHFYISR